MEGRFLKWEVRAYRDGVLFYKLRDSYITRLGAESASSYCSRVYMDAQRTEKEITNSTLRTLLQSLFKRVSGARQNDRAKHLSSRDTAADTERQERTCVNYRK